MAVFKGLYRGYPIYWHGKDGYGDETEPYYSTLVEARAAIDALIEQSRQRQDEEARRAVEAGTAVWGERHPDGSVTVGNRRFASMAEFRRHAFDDDMPDKIYWR